MNRFYLSKLTLLFVVFLGWNLIAHAQPVTFIYTGAVQTYTVPVYSTALTIDASGATGGNSSTGQRGGYGGRVQCTLNVTPGQVLYIYVGGAGTTGVVNTSQPGGFNDPGANGGYCTSITGYGGGGGGGGTDIRIGGTSLANRVVVAGGGGGGACNCTNPGGNGGGLIGQTAPNCSTEYCGPGGTQAGGGVGGTYSPYGTSGNGVLGYGGVASTAPTNSPGSAGGGGGGGYYGGAGGSWGGGGGGSSYTNPAVVPSLSVTHTQGYNTTSGANGSLTITPNCNPPSGGTISGNPIVCIGTLNSTLTTTGSTGGVWGSMNPTIASVDPILGIVTGIAAGTASITYTATFPCGSASSTPFVVTVPPSPGPISASSNICIGTPTTLSGTIGGGTWLSNNTVTATIGSSSGIITGLTAGIVTISYTATSGCYATYSASVNPAPNMYTITGGGSICQGAGGLDIRLSGSDALVNYQLFNSGTPGPIMAGVGHYLDFGTQTAGGTYSIVATSSGGGCSLNMASPQTITVNPVPALDSILNGGSYCAGGSGITLGLSNSVIGTMYQLYQGAAMIGVPVSGSGFPISFPAVTGAGAYTAKAYFASTGCTTNVYGSASVVVNPLPLNHNVTGGGSYCAGGNGVHIGLNGSTAGTTYQLNNGAPFGSVMPSTGGTIDFGPVSAVNTYNVLATTAAGCTAMMSGSATVTSDPLPANYGVTGGGSYCAGSGGLHITMPASGSGINYQLFTGAAPVSGVMAGSSGMLDFGAQTTSGTYYVIAENAVTTCADTMATQPVIVVNALPTPHNVMGGGQYCSGDTGVHVMLDNSDTFAAYTLYMGTSAVAGPITGTGSALDFGLQTMAGTYTVKASNIYTGCMNTMTGSAMVNINALPTPYLVTGGGGYCAGGTGASVSLSSSDASISYQLEYAGSLIGMPMAGTGHALNFGPQTGAGVYSVIATNTITSCQSMMADNVNITINPLPAMFNVTGGGNFCSGAVGVPVGLSFSNSGIIYALYKNSVATGTIMVGTGYPLTYGILNTPGVYTVLATNNVTGCVSNMTGSATVNPLPLPTVYAVSGGGTICNGASGVAILLSSSDAGINYQLYNGTSMSGSAVPGNGSGLSYGPETAAGVYTIMATNASSGCTSNMSGSATLTVNPLPTDHSVSGGGAYCAGGTGVNIGLTWGDAGISYQLYNGMSTSGTAVNGAGSTLTFGTRTAAGTYTVMATNMLTGCNTQMTGTATVTINPLPTIYTVMGGGNYCVGTPGVDISFSGSDVGISYQLYLGGTMAGPSMNGTGGPLDFGNKTAVGTYTVMATNMATGCTSPMAGSVTVGINPLPNVYSVTGGGTFCAGTTGVHVGITNTNTGIEYKLYNGTTEVGFPWTGTGGMVDFGSFAMPGIYTVVAMNSVTGCTNNMTGSATLIEKALVTPSVDVYSGSGDTVCQGANTTFSAVSVNGGMMPAYQWMVNSIPQTGATGTSFNYVPNNGDIIGATVTSSSDACASPGSASASVAMVVFANGLPDVSISANPGNTVCNGTSVLYTATPVYGGPSPIYTWKVNGLTQTASGATYAYVPANGDNVFCNVTSDYKCRTWPYASSNQINMTTVTAVTPSVEIFVTPGTTITKGTNAVFLSSVTNAGTSPAFQWSVNSVAVPGATSEAFSSASLSNNDVVSCAVTNSDICGEQTGSYSVTMTVLRNVGVQQVATSGISVNVAPNPNKGVFTLKGKVASTDENMDIEITNMLGQVVYTGKTAIVNGEISEQVVLNNNISSGMYLLNLRSGNEQTVIHFVVAQ